MTKASDDHLHFTDGRQAIVVRVNRDAARIVLLNLLPVIERITGRQQPDVAFAASFLQAVVDELRRR